jgi:hypothetical protein
LWLTFVKLSLRDSVVRITKLLPPLLAYPLGEELNLIDHLPSQSLARFGPSNRFNTAAIASWLAVATQRFDLDCACFVLGFQHAAGQ